MEQSESDPGSVTPVGVWLGRALNAVQEIDVCPPALDESEASDDPDRPKPPEEALELIDQLLGILDGNWTPAAGRMEARSTSKGASRATGVTGVELLLFGGTTVNLEVGEELVLGRAPADNVFCVPLPVVSRRHLSIRCRADEVVALDLGSSNGTAIVRDDEAIVMTTSESYPLEVDDRLVVLGQHLLAKVRAIHR